MIGLIILIGIFLFIIGGICYLRYKDKKRQNEREIDEKKIEAIRKFSSEIVKIAKEDTKLYKLAEMIKDTIPAEEDYKEFQPLTWGYLYNAVCAVLLDLLEEFINVMNDESLDIGYRRSLHSVYREWKTAFFFEKTEDEIGKLD